jgi:hypothetical protein
LSKKVTVPEITGFPLLFTVAVNVTGCPVVARGWLETRLVAVTAPLLSVKLMHQPPFTVRASLV